MPTKVDFTGVSDGFEPVPAGRYDAVFTGFKVQEAKSSGNQYVSLEFTLDDPNYAGRKTWQNNSLQPQALWALKRNCIALGADPDTLAEAVDLEELLGDLIGSECRLELEVKEYEGKLNNGITSILAVGI